MANRLTQVPPGTSLCRAPSKEPINNAPSYFGWCDAYIRPDKHGDNRGNPQPRRPRMISTRQLALAERDKWETAQKEARQEEAGRNEALKADKVKCTQVDTEIPFRPPPRTIDELKDRLEGGTEFGMEIFGGDSGELKDYHIIHDDTVKVWRCKPPGMVNVALYEYEDKLAKELQNDGHLDHYACLDRFDTLDELHEKLRGYLGSRKKNLVSVSKLGKAHIEQFLRNEADKDKQLKFILVTWSPKYLARVRQEQAALEASNAKEAYRMLTGAALALGSLVTLAGMSLAVWRRGGRAPAPVAGPAPVLVAVPAAAPVPVPAAAPVLASDHEPRRPSFA